ncbi:MAG TPA: choline ABC transporter ATP-binding protein [Acetobacteraceae bacterium]|nr:choline ABC transporter ATP-binding protein [Acetobacteraceae bacterium]
MSPAIDFRDVNILFGSASGRGGARLRERALAMLDAGNTRAEIAAATGIVIGVARASLSVARGEICVLMGLSGSGKSTLLRAANRLSHVDSGQVLVRDGEGAVDVARCDRATLRRIRGQRVAMVFQQFALLPWRSVRDNVGLGLELRGVRPTERRAIVDEKLRLVGLDNWADRAVAELSGGMQQRVGLARAFATDADILLMDEPFSALDPLIRTKLQDDLLELQRSVQKTILFVSHDLDEAMKLGNRIAILEGGRIVQTGTSEDIMLRPADDYVAEFVQHVNPLSVLRGRAIMRPLAELPREGNAVLLDEQGAARVTLDAERRPVSGLVGGIPCPLAAAGGAAVDPAALVVAPAELPLRALVALQRGVAHPLLLVEEDRLVGVCGASEIIGALSGRAERQPAVREAVAGV